jgi:hypothetical protein
VVGSPFGRAKIIVGGASAIAFVLCWVAGRIFDVPTFKGFSASLLTQPAWLTSLLIAAIAFALCAGIGTLIAGRVRPDAGIVVACFGWLAFTLRGGPMHATLHSDPSPGVFLILIVEMIILTVIAAVVAAAVRYLLRSRELEEVVEVGTRAPRGDDPVQDCGADLSNGGDGPDRVAAGAVGCQAASTVVRRHRRLRRHRAGGRGI